MSNKLKDLEENARLQNEVIKRLESIVKNLEKERALLREALEAKEQQIHELKVNGLKEKECECHRYSKSIEEIYKAGSKHKEKLLSLK